MNRFYVVFLAIGAFGANAAELVSNPGFEKLTDKQGVADWDLWTREKGKGRMETCAERHAGERGLHIVHAGEKDWALANARRTAVKPGESYKITCWMKRSGEAQAGVVNVVGNGGGKLVDWALGKTSLAKGDGWKAYKAYFTVPEGVDTAYVRVVGGGKADFWVDDVQVESAVPPAQVKGPKVSGWAQVRPVEPMGRGAVAAQVGGGVYISWRLLKDDPADIAFDLFR